MIILSALALLKCACTAFLRNDAMMQSAICGICYFPFLLHSFNCHAALSETKQCLANILKSFAQMDSLLRCALMYVMGILKCKI